MNVALKRENKNRFISFHLSESGNKQHPVMALFDKPRLGIDEYYKLFPILLLKVYFDKYGEFDFNLKSF